MTLTRIKAALTRRADHLEARILASDRDLSFDQAELSALRTVLQFSQFDTPASGASQDAVKDSTMTRLTKVTITRGYEAAADQETINFNGTLRDWQRSKFLDHGHEFSFFADEFAVDDGSDGGETPVIWLDVFVEVDTADGEGGRTFRVYDKAGALIDFERDWQDDCYLTIVRGRAAAETETVVVQ